MGPRTYPQSKKTMDFDLTGASIFATNQSRNGEMSIDMEPEGGGLGGVGALGRGRESGGRHEDQVTSRVNRFQKQAVAKRELQIKTLRK